MDTADRSHSTAQSRKPTLSIRARLVILALLAVVPLMLDRVRLLEQTRLERIDDAATEALELARRGADGQREIITAAKSMLQVMARAYVGMIATGTTCNFYLSDLAAGMPWVNGITIVGADGRVKCSTNPAAVGVDLSDRPHIQTAMETREFVVSNYIVGRMNRKPTFAAVYPTQAIDPNVQAAVTTSVDLQWVSALITSLERRAGSSVLLIDSQGTVIAGDPGQVRMDRQAHRRYAVLQAPRPSRRGHRPRRRPRRRPAHLRLRARAIERCAPRGRLERSGGAAAHRPRDPARLSAARLLRPAGPADCMVRRRAPDRRSDPVAGAHRRAHRPRRSAGARLAQGLGQGVRAAHRRAQRHGAEARRSRAGIARGQQPPSRSSRPATRCRASPTGAASTRGSPPTGSGPASFIGRSRCS